MAHVYEDYIERLIQQFAQVLKAMLAKLLELKNTGKTSESIEIISQTLKEELDLDLSRIIELPKKDFIDSLLTTKKFNNTNLEMFGDVLYTLAENNENPEEKKKIFRKSLEIYEFVDDSEKTYSTERYKKIEDIKQLLFN